MGQKPAKLVHVSAVVTAMHSVSTATPLFGSVTVYGDRLQRLPRIAYGPDKFILSIIIE